MNKNYELREFKIKNYPLSSAFYIFLELKKGITNIEQGILNIEVLARVI